MKNAELNVLFLRPKTYGSVVKVNDSQRNENIRELKMILISDSAGEGTARSGGECPGSSISRHLFYHKQGNQSHHKEARIAWINASVPLGK